MDTPLLDRSEYLLISLVKPLLSRNVCEKSVREFLHFPHCVTLCKSKVWIFLPLEYKVKSIFVVAKVQKVHRGSEFRIFAIFDAHKLPNSKLRDF